MHKRLLHLLSRTIHRTPRRTMSSTPKIISTSVMSASEAKWITLKKIKYRDAEGHERLWECAERTTRKSSGIDAVAVLAIIRSKTNAFPLSTIIIEQYRPPIDKFIIGCIRELEEETGFKATASSITPLIVCDPGTFLFIRVRPLLICNIGMTTANMKLVVLNVELADKMETPEQKLERASKQGFVVDARLAHWASGFELARNIARESWPDTCSQMYQQLVE
ncbi:hypothetical protein B0H12DRAFT_1212822 [Mycena haematopus]|nr:hypothetical protein B0H12DRAFT_1212822 [Mycena haematopus]